jgi:hypothetical protein
MDSIRIEFLVDLGEVVSAISHKLDELLQCNVGCDLDTNIVLHSFSAANDMPLNVYDTCKVHVGIVSNSF